MTKYTDDEDRNVYLFMFFFFSKTETENVTKTIIFARIDVTMPVCIKQYVKYNIDFI